MKTDNDTDGEPRVVSWDDDGRDAYEDDLEGYDEYPPPVRSRPSQNRGLLIGLFIGGGLVVLLCCGGGAGLVYFGMNVFTREVENELRGNPRLVEHLGDIQDFEMNWTASLAEEDDDTFVFEVRGTKASGEVTARSITLPDGTESVVSGTLRLADGRVIDLFPMAPAGGP